MSIFKKKNGELPNHIKYIDPNSPREKFAIFRIGVKRAIKKYFKRHRITGILLILLIGLSLANVIKNHVILSSYSKLTGDFQLRSIDEYIESLKDIPSDITGMSQYDKYVMGLDYHDNSDSDHDGLTDKEEIEKYKSDPLKSSTSGDLYTDGYKISHKMDINTTYELQGEQSFKNNECSEITLMAKEATDFTASIENYTGRYSLENWGISKVYKDYFIYNFAGTLSIDLTQMISEHNISVSDIGVWTYEGSFLTYGKSDLKECQFRTEGNKITLDYNFDKEKYTHIFITNKRTLINSLLTGLGNKQISQLNKADNPRYLFIHTLFGQKVYYESQEDKALEAVMIKNIDEANKPSNIEFIATSRAEIEMKAKIYKTVFPIFDLEMYDNTPSKGIEAFTSHIPVIFFAFRYCNYRSGTLDASLNGTNSENVQKYKYNNYHTTFDPNVDELPFQNFSSKHSNGGNCAGINYLTCYLYNQGYFPESGSYGNISWDISGDPENKTLMDKGLSDYKTNDFVDKKSSLTSYLDDGLTTGERQFVDMIGSCWKKTNDTLIQSCMENYRIENKNGLSWDTAEAMMQKLDQGKIITLSVFLNDNTAHQVILYDYYYINDSEVAFRVYDSNIPMNHTDDNYLNCDEACYLQCKKVKNMSGGYNLLYLYYPVEGATNYFASSDPALCKYSATIVSDETLQTYNH